MIKRGVKTPLFLLDFYYISLYIIGMKEIIWAIVAIGCIAVSTDIIEWLADIIEKRFNR